LKGGAVLNRFRVTGFKSLNGLDLTLPRLAVLFGPNSSGKSNVIDALQALARLATERTLKEALAEPIRGYPVEAFTLPRGGLPALLRQDQAGFELQADITTTVGSTAGQHFGYRIGVGIHPPTSSLRVTDEFLVRLTKKGDHALSPRIEPVDGGRLAVRRLTQPGQPRHEPLGGAHSQLSDARFSGSMYPDFERLRAEFGGWRAYYLDPRVAMRHPAPPSDTSDIGVLGENIAPYLFVLKNSYPKHYAAVGRAVRAIIPSISSVDVDLDDKRGTLDINIVQDGIPYSSRVVSEGTLRVLALCAIAVNPRPASLVAFEEPENGVHPRRIEAIADLLTSLVASGQTQLIVTTHSAVFAGAMLRRRHETPGLIDLFTCTRDGSLTRVRPLHDLGLLFGDKQIADALSEPDEDRMLTTLLLEGWVDG
jgi:predicted ATPase